MRAMSTRPFLAALPLALLLTFQPAYAEDEEVIELTRPSSFVTGGAGYLSGDPQSRSLFGQYNGLRDHDGVLLLDFSYIKRDEATGTWTIVEGRDLGLDTRQVRAVLDRQGHWRIFGEY